MRQLGYLYACVYVCVGVTYIVHVHEEVNRSDETQWCYSMNNSQNADTKSYSKICACKRLLAVICVYMYICITVL